ncbi:2-amino-4-hydroxy-6- hydroxymethyldihydropteridine pyrophosphokinase [Thioalkalivibrio nitratireducens DSM 14787]|uniref:2-amino-4-hydroxy-6-hydroxymethyldihydropteridine pyrophosphokinase n=1 Tax=Thioalkalivibrio nitratireducens (strain DSM 14787 / UNIQEM 213 / ALEN2) TaxID=1255043 RepID=L0DZI3_THIND|nr:2-amino-4-hydroxy-6-hydroxymethyldihydropteridine diphosphokinase [Thioalkalivibrio nitratireducens]AGA34453.1 2-amino-4-hydroxy-6- hydroxymethyldihydropteridine pyrophosphokinase [Thioalkalivibrio nitratireducens DSM 14787]
MKTAVDTYIGIGANLGDPTAQVSRACARLSEDIPGSRLVACSRLYRNPPMGPQDQPDYVNAVARIRTALGPGELLRELQRIELAFGRRRDGRRWGPRLLDLDILLYGSRVVDEPGLRVPHPGIAERDFVLFPLQELAPDLQIPGHGALSGLCSRMASGLVPIDGCLETVARA